MSLQKRAGIRLLSVLAAAAVAATALPAQLLVAADEIPIEPAAIDEQLDTYADGQNLLAGLEWTTNIPDEQFIYGQGPGIKPAIKGWLTDGIYDPNDYVEDGAQVVGFNKPGYLEFDLREDKTFRQVKITSATTQSFQQKINVFSQMKIEVYMNGSWEVVCDARNLPYGSLKTYVLGCSGENAITGSKIRFYFEPGGGLAFNVFNEFEVLEEAAAGALDGELTPPSDPTEIVNLSLGKPYTIRREENVSYPDTNGAELTDGVLGSQAFDDPAWSACSYGGSMSGKVYDRWPLRSVIIDLEGVKSITQIKANFLSEASKDVFQPRSIRTFASMDGENWMPLSRLNNINTYATGIQTYGWHVDGENGVAVDLTGNENSIVLAKYVRFDLEKFSWNFMDEVTVMGYDGAHSQALPVTNTTMLEDGEIQRADASTGNIHDMVLCYNGYGHRAWSVDRFKPYLTYVDESGNSLDTMFDAAMFLGLDAPGTSGQAFATENDQMTADGWIWYLEKTFVGETSDIAYLNEAARKASEDLSDPDYKINLTVMIPYPPSKAINFGSLGGRNLNLSVDADWKYAIDWYIGQVQDYIQNGNYDYIDFLGFYWVNEYPSGIPRIQYASEQVHKMGYKFYWIPYFSSVGYFWNADLGFDAITLQPNHFFADPNDNTFGAGGTKIIGTTAQIGAYAGLGVEMEFDGRLTTDVDKYNQGLDYLNGAVEYGFDGPNYYRNWYEGGGAISDISDSRIPVIREFYDNIYQLINGTYKPREYITSLADADPDNVLFGKKYTTSLSIGDPNAEGGPQGNYVGDDDGVKLTDGIYVNQNYHKSVGNREFADFTFDLGSSKTFQEVYVGVVSGFHGIVRPSRIQIQVSNDTEADKTWLTVFDGAMDNTEQTSRTFTYRTDNGEKIIARYLRFNVYFGPNSGWISLDEIKAYDKVSAAASDGTMTVPEGQPDPAEKPALTKDLPDSMEAAVGMPFTLSVEASVSDGGTLSYQWYKGGTAVGENSSTLTIAKAQQDDAGTYKVVVTNTLNGVTASSTSVPCAVTVSENRNILKGIKYTTSLRDGGANAGLGDFNDDHPDVERSKLTDGLYANGWSDANSIGYHSRRPVQPVDITFHIGDTPQAFQQINIGALSPDANGILLQSNTKIEIRNGPEDDWHIICDAPTQGSLGVNKRFVFVAEEGESFEATDIRFSLTPGSSWLFLDEIEAFRAADGTDADGILKEVAPVPPPSGENIALGRPYTTTFASGNESYYPRNPDNNYELTNGVVIGSLENYLNAEWTGYLNAQAVTHRFDFGEVATFSAIKAHIYTGNADGITTAQGYTVQVSNDGVRWQTVYEDTNTLGKDWLTYRAPEEGIRGRFVQVTLKTGLMLFMDEIQIWGEGGKELEPDPDPNTLANQAKGKAYYLYASDPDNPSATFPEADKAAWPDTTGSLLTDGVVDSTGQNKSQWVSWKKGSGSMNVSVEFDLGTEKAIHEITADFAQDAANKVGLPGNMQVFVSNQRNDETINWIKLYDEAVPASSGNTAKLTYTVPEIFRARYVKLVFQQTSDYMGIGEIEINGKGNTTGAADPIDLVSQGFVNLSKGKSYVNSESNTQYPDVNKQLTDGKYAVGGSEDKAWTGFSFTASKGNGTKSVKIDLGDCYKVSKISANFLTKSGIAALPKNVQFIVSQDGEKWTTVYNGKSISSSAETYKLQTFLGTPVKARYVMVYLYSESGLALMDEIEVFGDATPVKPDVTPPTPSTEAKNYLIPGEATGGIKNLGILDTADFQNAGSVLNQGFDGAAIVGEASNYGKILTDLNQKTNSTVKIVLGAKDAASIDSAVSAFESGSYGKLELVGILIESELSSADALTAKIHGKSLKAFWIGDYNASGIAGWKDHGIDAAICRAGSSNLAAAAKIAKENDLGMALDMSQGYDKYLDYLDAAVKDSFQGKYVFRAYSLDAQSGTDEQNARMQESTEKLMKGTLKASNRNTPAAPTAADTYSTWVSLKAVNGYEYSKDGSSWTIDPVFTGLTPETSYTFYQRIKENHSAEASLMSKGLNVTTPETPTEAEPMAPTFTTNLSSSKQAKAGDKITLTVAASVSDGGTLSYQWYKNDQAIHGATSAAYTMDSIQKSDEGNYKVIVTNTLNGATATAASNVCVITVEVPAEPNAPTITTDLNSSRTAKTGDRVTFAVTAVSNNNGTLSYQWYKNGKAIVGAVSASYTIASASLSDGGIYYVDVTDQSNSTHTISNSCTLTVTEKDVPSGGGSTGGWGGTTVKPDVVVGVWKQLSDGNWQYVEDNKPVIGWKSINSVQYYFNSDGIMETGWFKDGGHWYYLQDNGAMATGWVKVDNTWYYLRDNGRMATGWLKLGNTWYYLKSSGAMQTGWLQEGSTWYYLFDWGGMANSSWVKINGSWYYFRGNGAMMTGWLQQGGAWYYLNSSGQMATGWNWIGNKCYYFYDSGKMAADTAVGGYRVDASGAWVK